MSTVIVNLFVNAAENFQFQTTLGANVNQVFAYLGKDPYRVAEVTLSSANTQQISIANNTATINYKIQSDQWIVYNPIYYRIDQISNNLTTTIQSGRIFIKPTVIPS